MSELRNFNNENIPTIAMRSMLWISRQTIIMLSLQTIGAFLERSQTCIKKLQRRSEECTEAGNMFLYEHKCIISRCMQHRQ
jgi:hypothetical protein